MFEPSFFTLGGAVRGCAVAVVDARDIGGWAPPDTKKSIVRLIGPSANRIKPRSAFQRTHGIFATE